MADIYKKCSRFVLSKYELRSLDCPHPDRSGSEGRAKLYGDQYGFKKGACKRCDKTFDTTFTKKETCDFHVERSRKIRGVHKPHGCCGSHFGGKGCRSAPSHVYIGNLYLDVEGFTRTQPLASPSADGNYGIHTVKGLEVCKVSVINSSLETVYDEFCLPTTEIIDYNTIWSGIRAEDLQDVTKTWAEMRQDLLGIFNRKTILVGHGLGTDLRLLKILHNRVVDTLKLYPHPHGSHLRRSLKDIAQSFLGRSIQTGEGHDSHEDAEVAMQLVLRKL
ncbi:GOR-like protein [Mya arenaria]|uniref:GOR-like protein n=1 Tax=Mya arenaria TaxID=6604 RepID=A0ABY7FDC2_MYAAR|nr:GOR-like protein [Mya arenaria]